MTAEEVKNNQVITFGCRLNAFESEAIKKALELSGEKNLIVFNSCAVTAEAEKELRAKIRLERKKNPQAKIVVTGCASQIDPQKYAQMNEVDLVIGNAQKSSVDSYKLNDEQIIDKKNQPIQNSKTSIDDDKSNNSNESHHSDKKFNEFKSTQNYFLKPQEHAKIKVNDIMSVRDTSPHLVSYFENQTRAFLEIQNGCNHRCTFCIIPYGRGNSRSVPLGEIVEQTNKMANAGHREIVLTGVDISDYGKDLPSSLTLSQMIRRVLKMTPSLDRLRLSSVDVAEIDNEFFEILRNEPRLMPYLHLSVQSGDDMILKRMKRRHDRNQVIDFCLKARQIRPEITFGADIIAGFPTEDESMFQNSLSLISKADLIFTHIFPYSARQGTPAYKMPQLDKKIIKERAKILREAGENQLNKYLLKQIGKNFKVLIEKNNRGKTENFLDVEIQDSSNQKIIDNTIYDCRIIATKAHKNKTILVARSI
ncbi:MAG: tRNA (N(6)-L-threonylcarbamoyladenosine(37)-C(2))-methylthiotransferase MtaB [Alphaproteobacteria bacterium]|nr:tRNA (N(6)-L-threonylcarbamoyladenosine(37)-C(2))-methylthiotransferase MtaB [Alphaproteobacteria bacterium]